MPDFPVTEIPKPQTGVRDVEAADVAAFLRANPRFLAEHPALYRALAPPERVHGAKLADHMAAMLRAERAHALAMAERADDVLAAGRASAGLTTRVQNAVLALMRSSSDPALLADCITLELPVLLAVDGASLCCEGDMIGARAMPAGLVARLLDGRAAVFREGGDEAALLHAEAMRLARHEALVRIPGEGPPALLALSSRSPEALEPSQGTGALAFLGRAIAAALGR